VYPCRIQLILAANPCPCASSAGDQNCQCPSVVRRRYLNRLSGPLLDRVDLRVTLAPVTTAALLAERPGEPSKQVAGRVAQARAASAERWEAHGWLTNADVPGPMLRQRPFRLPLAVTAPLSSLLDRGAISVRGYDRILRTAWSIVDLDGRIRPRRADIDEAIELRQGTPR
jgi:magnesium chelatase family protein